MGGISGDRNNTFTYDADGNLGLDSVRNTSYLYSYRNRLDGITKPVQWGNNYLEYTYDQNGLRVLKKHFYYYTAPCDTGGGGGEPGDPEELLGMTTMAGGIVNPDPPGGGGGGTVCVYDKNIQTRYLRSQGNVLMEVPPYDIEGDSNRYIFAGDDRIAVQPGDGRTYYYLKDHLGSSRVVLADTSGGYVYAARYKDYRAFGQMEDEEVSLNLKYKYTGKPFDDEQMIEKMYYYSSRYYIPLHKRFPTVDPLLGKNPSISPYTYCLNNPLKYRDPDGRAAAAAAALFWVAGGALAAFTSAAILDANGVDIEAGIEAAGKYLDEKVEQVKLIPKLAEGALYGYSIYLLNAKNRTQGSVSPRLIPTAEQFAKQKGKQKSKERTENQKKEDRSKPADKEPPQVIDPNPRGKIDPTTATPPQGPEWPNLNPNDVIGQGAVLPDLPNEADKNE